MGKLDGKVAVITGATSGMGRATAKKLASEGAEVVIVGRNCERGEIVVSEIVLAGGKAQFFHCDVSRECEIVKLFDAIKLLYPIVDILFNNAGIFVTEPLENIDEEKLNHVFSTDFNSAVLMTKYYIKQLGENKGIIVNNASMGGLEAYTNGTKSYLYHSAKSALIKFSKLTAKNYAPNIRVNCICPGIIDTEIFTNRDFSRFDGTIPMGHLGKPEDIANLVCFLASDESSYITGSVITIDGGASLS